MSSIDLKELIKMVKSYNPSEIDNITKAYNFAANLHSGQFRQSGEPYITHPLNVAYILAEMHADGSTLCAALLHDTLEDTSVTKEEIVAEFNEEVANLVDGVTKLAKMNFTSKEDQNLANTRKIITGITEDVRIIIIKLADRLHNMRTLEFKKPKKQQENALETMEIFAPLAYYIGAYRIKNELEDLSFSYLMPDAYKKTEEEKLKLEESNSELLKEMLFKIQAILNDKNIPNEIKLRTKNVYGIYKRLSEFHDVAKIHDLFTLKIMVDEIETCYLLLYYLHQQYKPLNDMKDYICNPKINMYQSLHSTVFGPKGRLVQAQIRTFEMDRTASFGLPAYWDTNNGDGRYKMQQELREKSQFFESLTELDEIFFDNKDFINQVKFELLGDTIVVYTRKGDRIELPVGSTPIDFAYKINAQLGNTMVKVLVNDEEVPFDHILRTDDRIRIITDSKTSGPKRDWINLAKTSHARKRIRDFNNN